MLIFKKQKHIMSKNQLNIQLNQYYQYILNGTLIEEIQSFYQKISVWDTEQLGHILMLDNYPMLSAKEEFIYHENLIHIPMVTYHEPKNILVIGGGDGCSLRELLKYPSIQKIDLVEIDKEVIDISKKYFTHLNKNSFNNSKVNLIIEDGKVFIKQSTESNYDLIFLDLTDPIGPSLDLFKKDFYSQCKKTMNPIGLLNVQIGCPILNKLSFQNILKDLRLVFKYVRVYGTYMATYGTYCYFACCSDYYDPYLISKKELSQKFMSYSFLDDCKYYDFQCHYSIMEQPKFIKEIIK